MADANVPIKFEIYKGDQLVREEVLAQSPIKIGKLASSDLRLDDETVSRMHGVIEATGPGDVHVVDLGSTRGTTVNGERVTKARLQSGDEVTFGDCRVIVTFGDAMQSQATPAPQAWGGGRVAPRRRLRAAAADGVRAAAAAAVRAAAPSSRYQQPQSYARRRRSRARRARAPRSRSTTARARWRFRPSSAASSPGPATCSTRKGRTRTARARRCCTPASAAAVLALGVFVSTAMDVGAREGALRAVAPRPARTPRASSGRTAPPASGAIVFGGLLGGIVLAYMGLKRRGKTSPNFLVGSDGDVDAPVSSEYVPSSSHPLVAATGADYVVNVTPRMTGEVYVDNQSYQLQQFIQQRGSSFSLPAGRLGAPRLRRDDVRRHRDAAPAHARRAVPDLALGRAGLHGRLGRRARPVPADDLLGSAGPEVAVARPLQLRQPLREVPDQAAGGEGRGHPRVAEVEEGRGAGRQGQAPQGRRRQDGQEDLQEQGGSVRPEGSEGQPGSAPRQEARRGAGQERRHPRRPQADRGLAHRLDLRPRHRARQRRRRRARRPDRQRRSARPTASAVSAWSAPARAAAAPAKGTIGLGNLGTIGKGGGGGNGSGYGRGAGGLGGRRAKAPDVIPGQANVRGSLDKEIIRRIIRRHINEVKYCYEQELTKKPDLGGRIMVQFTIAASGQVIASVLQNSTMGNARVENCTVQAVRRWEFPKPLGGGIVIVSYPFVLTPAGGGE